MKKTAIKTTTLWIVIIVLCMSGVLAANYEKILDAQYGGITIFVDDAPITPWDADKNIVKPFIFEGTTYLPVRAISEALGKQVRWDGETYSVFIEGQMEQPAAHEQLFPLANGDNYVSDIKMGISWEDFQQQHADLILNVSGLMDGIENFFRVEIPGAVLNFEEGWKWLGGDEFESRGYFLTDIRSESDQYTFPRDIHVGDNIASVLMKFPIQGGTQDGYYYISDGQEFFKNIEDEYFLPETSEQRPTLYSMRGEQASDGSGAFIILSGMWRSSFIEEMYEISYNTERVVDGIRLYCSRNDQQENEKIQVQYNDISIYIDAQRIKPADADGNVVEPFIYNGTTYLPVRAISEALDKTVRWEETTKSIYIS